jgi:hypothetical protein
VTTLATEGAAPGDVVGAGVTVVVGAEASVVGNGVPGVPATSMPGQSVWNVTNGGEVSPVPHRQPSTAPGRNLVFEAPSDAYRYPAAPGSAFQ